MIEMRVVDVELLVDGSTCVDIGIGGFEVEE